jgi:hypothetical protein
MVMPLLFWFPAIIMSEMWSMAWAEMPLLMSRPLAFHYGITADNKQPTATFEGAGES